MLTSFFSNSKPFHFIVVSLLLFSGCFVYIIQDFNEAFYFSEIVVLILKNWVFLFLFLVLSFIIKKNKLTQLNSYALFLFCCFILMAPVLFKDYKPVYSLLFLLLALRRILSLSSKKNIQKKILDASIWISIASLFYFWSILFFVVLFVVVFQLASKNYRLIFIPIVGFISIFILVTTYNLLVNDTIWRFLDYSQQFDFDFSVYYHLKVMIPTIFILLLGVLGVIFKFIKFPTTPLKEKSKYWILIISLFLSLLLIILTNNKNGSELIFLFVPISIFTANILESIRKKWIVEVTLWIAVIIPVVVYFI